MMKKSDGFTLVELLVGIFCASIVTAAAMTLMLMGARTNRALLDANSEQQTARIITTMVESLASEGDISKIYVGYDEYAVVEDYGEQDWAIFGTSPSTPVLSYSFDEQTIFTADNNALMAGVTSSTLTLSRNTLSGCLLSFTIQTEENQYEITSYCRAVDIAAEGLVLDKDNLSADDSIRNELLEPDSPAPITPNVGDGNETGRFAFLQALCSQYGSTGKLTGSTGVANFSNTFSGWYTKTKHGESSYMPGWSTNTPWCACFVSWGIYQVKDYLNYDEDTLPCFAHVKLGYEDFRNGKYGQWIEYDDEYSPQAGDLVFFDWDAVSSLNTAPIHDGLDHVGVVFYCDDTYLYTIEGNTSVDSNGIGRVDLKRYYLNATTIKGYGVLDWKTTS